MSHKPTVSHHRVGVENSVDSRWRQSHKEPLVSVNQGHPMGQPHVPHAAAVDHCSSRGCATIKNVAVSSHRAASHSHTFSDAFPGAG